ncbi:adenosine deaminase [Saccharopolyspora erythraea NRRL 2338]|uniref:Adenosine deaminase n=2 Tax=Saccharopolyspora erythraea TaxID=1836 RepID=A4FFR1_SACEN|nr:adenosine deaminase [Saccharopolyspora erythraea]EQD82423.1 adenosine deaminase [Saccharopolyspora erythraea D]PFG96604.1 adenosine deaminase [Saccharopolyspora erythraea NRRL 2338]QRK93079.1 adenosine deaminase [Saccharopolyspora erythraea]CAM02886.1 adenosine deaminase [Saccharopolyspora erythraea NRRL 2338]
MRDPALLPKAHLHVHLESTVRWDTLRELGRANGVAVPDRPAGFTGFRQFADHNSLVRHCLVRPADFTRVAREFCHDEAAQGTRYAEVTFTAASHGERLGAPEMPLEAVLEGLALGQAETGLRCRVLLDHSRRRSVRRAWRTLHLATRYDEVAGIGMAGEESYPLEPFADVLDAARDAGVALVHHAGEACGADSIREAIHTGHAQRIGHGIRVLDDPALTAEIRDRGIALEVCPSSNVLLGFAASPDAHPLAHMRAAGLAVTVNTDIPAIAGTTLTDEYALVRDTFGYDDHDLAALARTAVQACFADEQTKRDLHHGIDAWLAAPAADTSVHNGSDITVR